MAGLTRTRRGLVSELALNTTDGVPTDSVVNFDIIHTIPRDRFRRKVATLSRAPHGRGLSGTAGCHRVLIERP